MKKSTLGSIFITLFLVAFSDHVAMAADKCKVVDVGWTISNNVLDGYPLSEGTVVSAGSLKIRVGKEIMDEDRNRAFILELKAPNFRKEVKMGSDDGSVTVNVCGEEIVISSRHVSGFGRFIRVSVF